jgi:hypothetical protein
MSRKRSALTIAITVILSLLVVAEGRAQAPLAVDPTNPQYFNYNGKFKYLVGMSGDYLPHVDQTQFPCGLNNFASDCVGKLQAQGLNKIRLWLSLNQSAGVLFNHRDASGNIVPYNHEQPFVYKGLIGGVPTWDLDNYDTGFWNNVRTVLQTCSTANPPIFVEVTLFDAWQGADAQTGPWSHHIQTLNGQPTLFGLTQYVNSFDNNTNPTSDTDPARMFLRQEQVKFVQKAVTTLNDFNNFYWEIANEPELNGVADITALTNWHNYIADQIYNAESPFGRHHLIGVNYTIRGSINNAAADTLHHIDIISSHYAKITGAAGGVPESARNGAIKFIRNYNGGTSPVQSNKVFGFTEDKATGVTPVVAPEGARAGAWEFMLNEGGTLDHLRYDANTSSNYNTLLVQYGFLNRFVGSLPLRFVRRATSATSPDWIFSGLSAYPTPSTTTTNKFWAALQKDGDTYALYIHNSKIAGVQFDYYVPSVVSQGYVESLTLQNLGAAGCYQYNWYDPSGSRVDATGMHSLAANVIAGGSGTFTWPGSGTVLVNSPRYDFDIALLVKRCP